MSLKKKDTILLLLNLRNKFTHQLKIASARATWHWSRTRFWNGSHRTTQTPRELFSREMEPIPRPSHNRSSSMNSLGTSGVKRALHVAHLTLRARKRRRSLGPHPWIHKLRSTFKTSCRFLVSSIKKKRSRKESSFRSRRTRIAPLVQKKKKLRLVARNRALHLSKLQKTPWSTTAYRVLSITKLKTTRWSSAQTNYHPLTISKPYSQSRWLKNEHPQIKRKTMSTASCSRKNRRRYSKNKYFRFETAFGEVSYSSTKSRQRRRHLTTLQTRASG